MNLNDHIAACQALVAEDAANGELPVFCGDGRGTEHYENAGEPFKAECFQDTGYVNKFCVAREPEFPNCIVIE